MGYVGAGTVEFLLDGRENFYFLEMNTRLQVEHPITEETLGSISCAPRLEVAAGEPLPAAWIEGRLSPQGHAIELRLYAEDPATFLPRTGRVLVFEPPSGPGVRVDAGVEEESSVGLDYDPLLAKLVVSAPDRAVLHRPRAQGAAGLGRSRRRDEQGAPFRGDRLAGVCLGRLRDGLRSEAELSSPKIPDAAWIAAALSFSASRSGEAVLPLSSREPWDTVTGWRAGR